MATYAAYRHIELDNIGYGKKRVLKPPGGGSSDIFGGANESVEVRKVRAKQAASSNLFLGSSEMTSGLATPASGVSQPPQTNGVAPKNGNGNAKLGNSSYQRIFGEYHPPATPSKNYMKSSIILDALDEGGSSCSLVNGHRSSNGSVSAGSGTGSISSESSTPEKGNSPRENRDSAKSSRSSPRNPVTGAGYGFEITSLRGSHAYSAKRRDGNPVTGEGYDSNASSKPSTPLTNGSSNPPSTPNTAQSRQRVPPGGFSSGLW